MEQLPSLVEYGSRRVIITITAVVCALLEIIDTTIVNVALPDMRGSLGATLNEVSWVITAYSLANVIVVPMTSWLSQQFGRRNYFAVSVVIFTICSFSAEMPPTSGNWSFSGSYRGLVEAPCWSPLKLLLQKAGHRRNAPRHRLSIPWG